MVRAVTLGSRDSTRHSGSVSEGALVIGAVCAPRASKRHLSKARGVDHSGGFERRVTPPAGMRRRSTVNSFTLEVGLGHPSVDLGTR